MTKIFVKPRHLNRDEFLTPFDKIFDKRSVNYGRAICYKQTWNQECHTMYMSIDRLSDIMTRFFG